jgi:hypothetical protein
MNFPAVPTHDPTAFPPTPTTPVYILPPPVKTTKEELLKVINRIYYEFYVKYIRSCKMDAEATALNEELKRFTRDYNDPNYYNKGGYNKSDYNKSGYNKSDYNKSGYNKSDYNKSGYNKSDYNRGGRRNKTSKSMPGNPRKKKNQKTKKRKN